jgi:hypothetical protein
MLITLPSSGLTGGTLVLMNFWSALLCRVAGWAGARVRLAVFANALTWLAAVPMTYLTFINAGYLPWGVSIATFLLFSPALPYILPDESPAIPPSPTA